MARPRKYPSEVERREARVASQRAYRRRKAEQTISIPRAPVERLLAAAQQAAAVGDPFARLCLSDGVEAVLERLAIQFERATLDPCAGGEPRDT